MRFGVRESVVIRFALAWVVPGFVILSLISGKQPHYLFPLLPGVALLAAKALPSDRRQTVIALSLVSPLLVILVETAGKGYLDRSDLRPVSSYLHQAEASGRPIAFKGQYSGTFHFLGRLERPIAQAELGAGSPMGSGASHRSSDRFQLGCRVTQSAPSFTSPIAGDRSACGGLPRCHTEAVLP